MKLLSILFPPQLTPLHPEHLRGTLDYVARISRRGVENKQGFRSVVFVGPAQFKKILYLPGRVV